MNKKRIIALLATFGFYIGSGSARLCVPGAGSGEGCFRIYRGNHKITDNWTWRPFTLSDYRP